MNSSRFDIFFSPNESIRLGFFLWGIPTEFVETQVVFQDRKLPAETAVSTSVWGSDVSAPRVKAPSRREWIRFFVAQTNDRGSLGRKNVNLTSGVNLLCLDLFWTILKGVDPNHVRILTNPGKKKLLRIVSWRLNAMCLGGDWTSPGDPNFLLSGAHPPSTGKRDNPAFVRSGRSSHDFPVVGVKLIHPVLGGASNIFLFFTPNLGEIRSNLTSIFFKQSGVSPSGRVVGVSIPIIYNPRNLERAPKPENLIALATSKTGSVWIRSHSIFDGYKDFLLKG